MSLKPERIWAEDESGADGEWVQEEKKTSKSNEERNYGEVTKSDYFCAYEAIMIINKIYPIPRSTIL